MAKRTYNRTPLSVSTEGINESYFNFPEFKGICDNKNYISIDQATFVDAKNVYVDNNNQLSSRPKLQTISVFEDVNTHILEIINLGAFTFYHTVKGSTYSLKFKFEDNWKSITVSKTIKLAYVNDMYVIFSENDIKAFWIEDGELVTASAADVIYTPITTIASGTQREVYQSENALTNKVITRYLFTKGDEYYPTLINKLVTVQIGNESFKIIFKQDSAVTFTSEIGIITVVPTRIYTTRLQTFLAVEGSNVTDLSHMYYSVDGVLFTEITPPDVAISGTTQFGAWTATISNSGDTLIVYTMYLEDNERRSEVYVATIDTSDPTPEVVYSLIDLTDENPLYHCNAGSYNNSNYTMYSTNYKSASFQAFAAIAAYDSSWIVVIIPCDITYDTKVVVSTNPAMDYDISSPTLSDQHVVMYKVVQIIKSSTGSYNVTSDYLADNGEVYGSGTASFAFNYILSLGLLENYRVIYFSINVSAASVNSCRYIWFSNIAGKLYYRFAINALSQRCQKNAGNISTTTDKFAGHYIASRQNDNIIDLVIQVRNSNNSVIATSNFAEISSNGYTMSAYTDTKTYSASDYPTDNNTGDIRQQQPRVYEFVRTIWSNSSIISTTVNMKRAIQYTQIYNENIAISCGYYFKNQTAIPLLNRGGIPCALYCDEDTVMYYYDNTTDTDTYQKVYSTNFSEETYIDIESTSDGQSASYTYLLPSFVDSLVNPILTVGNEIYIGDNSALSSKQMLYFPTNNITKTISDITNVVTFSTTSLGIFLENDVYELKYSTSNNLPVYTLTKTKLQLGCKPGSDVMLTYDGQSILTTNLKGLSALSYEDFVQSTDQIYSYLTENIITSYEQFAKSASTIKLYQYKNWIFMYSPTLKDFYVYDMRSASWWHWESKHTTSQIINIDNELYLRENDDLFKFVEEFENYYDNATEPIEWMFKSQKLHFGYPNNYKHVKSLTILASDDKTGAIVSKLKFYNYRNFMYENKDVVEYDVKQLTTFIKKVNFMKTNAFQFEISNYVDVAPIQFKTPNIAIKYRITEKVR